METLPALVERVLEIAESDQEWWFRGHGRASWELSPSLYRSIPDVATALQKEERVFREFDNRSRTLAERSGAGNPWELFFLMQHHRVPTRLLDWSRNLLIATFFAVHDEGAWEDATDPPAVFVLSPRRWNSKVVGTAGLVAAGPTGIVGDLNEGIMVGYQVRAPGGPMGTPQEHAVAIAGPEFATRIAAQRGAFTVFGTQPPGAARSMNEQESALGPDPSTLSRILLDGDGDDWKRCLALVGIGEFTAFPDLDGLARELRTNHF